VDEEPTSRANLSTRPRERPFCDAECDITLRVRAAGSFAACAARGSTGRAAAVHAFLAVDRPGMELGERLAMAIDVLERWGVQVGLIQLCGDPHRPVNSIASVYQGS